MITRGSRDIRLHEDGLAALPASPAGLQPSSARPQPTRGTRLSTAALVVAVHSRPRGASAGRLSSIRLAGQVDGRTERRDARRNRQAWRGPTGSSSANIPDNLDSQTSRLTADALLRCARFVLADLTPT
jgi:hypothetical protein